MASGGIGSSAVAIRTSRPKGSKPGSVLPAGTVPVKVEPLVKRSEEPAIDKPAASAREPLDPVFCPTCGSPFKRPKSLARHSELCSQGLKRCNHCDTVKPRGAFASHSGRADGLQQQCRECVSGYSRALRKRGGVRRLVEARSERIERECARQDEQYAQRLRREEG